MDEVRRSFVARWALGLAIATAVVLIGYVAWNTGRGWSSFEDITALEGDIETARGQLEDPSRDDIPPPPEEEMLTVDLPFEQSPPTGDVAPELASLIGQQLPYDPNFAEGDDIPDEDFDAYLIIGSDERDGLGGSRADVIILVLEPADDGPHLLVSLPRDLYLPNPCYRAPTRINAALNGCGDLANGPELLAVMVADYTGIEADHFALFDFPGFIHVVDALGGVQICVGPNPVRAGAVELPSGCSEVDGEQALAWARSRKTQELANGRWQRIPGVNDLTRTERQQDLLLSLFDKIRTMRDPGAIATALEDLSGVVRVDQGVTLGDALGIAWGLRDLNRASVVRLRPDVTSATTDSGAAVLLPIGPFAQVLDQAERH